MGYEIVNKPDDEQTAIEVAKELVNAAVELEMNIDVHGFVYAWAGGTKVVIERNSEDKIVSMGFLAGGDRWTDNDTTAHVLKMAGDRKGLLEFFKVICKAIGAKSLFYQEDVPLEETKGYNRYIITEIKV